MTFSVIIPTLNEEAAIGMSIARLRAVDPGVEIVVADGGSVDNTVAIARGLGVVVCQSSGGRGPQCNAGAAVAGGDVLVFLHADTELPRDAFAELAGLFQDDQVHIGTFRLAFDAEHRLLKLYSLATRLDSTLIRFGDQCIVVRRSFFDSLGGFPPWRFFEDLALIRKARRRTKVYRFRGTVTTSARRYLQNGVIRQQVRNVWFTLRYLAGGSPQKLAADYERRGRAPQGASLIIFVRLPRPGKVKARLAAAIGDEAAAAVYGSCAEHVLRESRRLSGQITPYVFYSEAGDESEVRRWAGPGFRFVQQSEGDLGQRIERAFAAVFSHGARKVVIVATDVPDLSAESMDEAFSALASHDVVIGPSHDGGYYLLGMKRLHHGLFRSIQWGTADVLWQTLGRVDSLGLAVHLLAPLLDVDTEDDLRAWSRSAHIPQQHHPVRDLVRTMRI